MQKKSPEKYLRRPLFPPMPLHLAPVTTMLLALVMARTLERMMAPSRWTAYRSGKRWKIRHVPTLGMQPSSRFRNLSWPTRRAAAKFAGRPHDL